MITTIVSFKGLTSAKVTIHPSQFPDAVLQELIESLRNSCVPPKFLYDSVYQTQKWLKVHRVYSPSRIDSDVARVYNDVLDASFHTLSKSEIALIGLGCGGGQKDARCLAKLKSKTSLLHYVPSDVSLPMTLVARQEVSKILNHNNIYPLVCDLSNSDDMNELLEGLLPFNHKRIFTFFGMIPNLDPDVILPKIFEMVREGDSLLMSVNLVHGDSYRLGVESVLPQYDNMETRDWLLSFLVGLGIQMDSGNLSFGIEELDGLLRIVADFNFTHTQSIQVMGESIAFKSGQSLRLFYSYRHTLDTLKICLSRNGLMLSRQAIAKSAEEGVFEVKRAV